MGPITAVASRLAESSCFYVTVELNFRGLEYLIQRNIPKPTSPLPKYIYKFVRPFGSIDRNTNDYKSPTPMIAVSALALGVLIFVSKGVS